MDMGQTGPKMSKGKLVLLLLGQKSSPDGFAYKYYRVLYKYISGNFATVVSEQDGLSGEEV